MRKPNVKAIEDCIKTVILEMYKAFKGSEEVPEYATVERSIRKQYSIIRLWKQEPILINGYWFGDELSRVSYELDMNNRAAMQLWKIANLSLR